MFRGCYSALIGVMGVLLLLGVCTFVVPPGGAMGGGSTATTTPQEEAGATSNNLVGPTWQWIQTKYGNDTVLKAGDPSKYTLTFSEDGTVAVQLDCNSGSGTYKVDGSSLTFGPIASTMMACPDGSQATEFARDLDGVVSYVMQDGHLFLAIKFDTGIMEFAPAGETGAATAEATEKPSEEATMTATEEATEEATAEPTEEATQEVTGEVGSNPLVGPTWQWLQTTYAGGSVLTATDPSRYTLTFHNDGTVAVQLDCNSGSATYKLAGSKLTFGPIASTLMACPEDSQATEFAKDLARVNSYVIDSGHLSLTVNNAGEYNFMEFAPAEENGAATAQATAQPTEEATEEATEEPSEEATVTPTEEAAEEATVTATEEATGTSSAAAGGVLTGTTWLWSKTVITDVTTTPVDPSRYSITFKDDGTTLMKLDCNTGRATFTLVDPNKLTVNPILVTKKVACPADTQDAFFSQNLHDAVAYTIADGVLQLALSNDGTMELTEQK